MHNLFASFIDGPWAGKLVLVESFPPEFLVPVSPEAEARFQDRDEDMTVTSEAHIYLRIAPTTYRYQGVRSI